MNTLFSFDENDINICGLNSVHNDDPYYRHKRKRARLKYRSGSTSISNLKEIVKAMDECGIGVYNDKNKKVILKHHVIRDIDMMVMFLKISLGTSYNKKTNEFRCKITEKAFNSLIETYVHHMVLCKHCGSPETILVYKKSFLLICTACGGKKKNATNTKATNSITITTNKAINSMLKKKGKTLASRKKSKLF